MLVVSFKLKIARNIVIYYIGEGDMNFNSMYPVEGVDFGEMFSGQYLLGLISAFDNRFQAKADKFFQEISWKQFFAIICINLCKESPTIG